MKMHIHVYKIAAKAEVNLEADNAEKAQTKALEKAANDELVFAAADCQFIAMPWKFEGGMPLGPPLKDS